MPRSLRQSHAAHEVGKARIGAKVVELRINFKPGQLLSAVLIALFEPFQGLIFLAESRIDECKAKSRNVALPGNLLELVERPQRFFPLACSSIDVSEQRQHARVILQLLCLVIFIYRLLERAFHLISYAEVPMSNKNVLIHLD